MKKHLQRETPSKDIGEVTKGFRHCFDTEEEEKRGCDGCPYETLPLPHCMKRLQSDVLESLKRRML